MDRVRTFFIGAACMLFALSGVAVAEDELVSRYLTAANDQYATGNYAKAFSSVNDALGSYKDADVPQDVKSLAETVYYAYLSEMNETRNLASFGAVKEKLIEFPFLSSERIARLVKIINTYEAQDAARGADPAKPVSPPTKASGGNPVPYNMLELQLALESVRKDAVEQNRQMQEEYGKKLLDTQRDAYERVLAETREATGVNNRILFLILLVLAGICFIVFVIVIVDLVFNLKNSRSQNEKFAETLKAVAELSKAAAGQRFGALPPVYGMGDPVRMIGGAVKDTGLPPPPSTEAERLAFAELAKKCRDIGLRIDQATGRKNNSKNVAELVYKVALEMGAPEPDAMFLFTVALVYDIGFLELDPALLQAEQLTDAQKFEIRNHVKQGLAQISFVPDKYVPVFADGISMHHENMDGSGYPEGLSGGRIPYVARLIRVSESFIALISHRKYRVIYDKESAIEELRKKPGVYDPAIVDVLEKII